MAIDMGAMRVALARAMAAVPAVNEALPKIPTSINPPVAFVVGPEINYDTTMARGLDSMHVIVRILVSYGDLDGAQDLLDSMLAGTGENSLKVAIEADRTLGGAVSGCRVARSQNYGGFSLGTTALSNITYLGAELVVEVYG